MVCSGGRARDAALAGAFDLLAGSVLASVDRDIGGRLGGRKEGGVMRDIKGFEGLYAVTEDGRVWSYPKQCKQ